MLLVPPFHLKNKAAGQDSPAASKIFTHGKVYCPTKKMALLRTSLPDSQNPLKMGLSTK